jgi:hypothetical protein
VKDSALSINRWLRFAPEWFSDGVSVNGLGVRKLRLIPPKKVVQSRIDIATALSD